MDEFLRKPDTKNNFEDNLEEIIEITLKIKDDFDSTYNRHSENQYRFDQVKKMLSSENRICFFQKKKNEFNNQNAAHKIIIPIGKERAIEATIIFWTDKLDVFTDLYSYRVKSFKEVSFFNEPTKHTLKSNCIFKFTEIEQKSGSNKESFIELFKSIESLEIPTLDINKEKDKQIWHSYVVAMCKSSAKSGLI